MNRHSPPAPLRWWTADSRRSYPTSTPCRTTRLRMKSGCPTSHQTRSWSWAIRWRGGLKVGESTPQSTDKTSCLITRGTLLRNTRAPPGHVGEGQVAKAPPAQGVPGLVLPLPPLPGHRSTGDGSGSGVARVHAPRHLGPGTEERRCVQDDLGGTGGVEGERRRRIEVRAVSGLHAQASPVCSWLAGVILLIFNWILKCVGRCSDLDMSHTYRPQSTKIATLLSSVICGEV